MFDFDLRIWYFRFKCKSIAIMYLKTSDSTLHAKRYEYHYDNPASMYLFKVNNGKTKTMCETCSMLTKKTPERPWRRTLFLCLFINFEPISHILLLRFLILNKLMLAGNDYSVHWLFAQPSTNLLKKTLWRC